MTTPKNQAEFSSRLKMESEIDTLRRKLNEARRNLQLVGFTANEQSKQGPTMSDTPRTDEHLLQQQHTYSPAVSPRFARQLERELNEAKSQAQVSDTERRAFITDLESVQQGLINDRDRWRTMAQELAIRLNGAIPDDQRRWQLAAKQTLSRFNELNQ